MPLHSRHSFAFAPFGEMINSTFLCDRIYIYLKQISFTKNYMQKIIKNILSIYYIVVYYIVVYYIVVYYIVVYYIVVYYIVVYYIVVLYQPKKSLQGLRSM